MSIQIKDTNNIIYTFNSTFDIKGLPFRIRVNKQDIAYSHGAKDLGDNKVDERTVILEGYIYGNTTSDYESALADLQEAVYKQNQKLYYDTAKYINVKSLEKLAHRFVKGAFNYVAEIEIRFLCEDPFFYQNTQTAYFKFLEQGGSAIQFSLNNPGNVEVFPVIGMTTRVPNSDFSLKNITAGLSFAYQDSGFIEGQTVTFDCQKAEVKRSGVNSIRYFQGSFLNLVPGTNTLEYVGATICGLSILYFERNL